MNNRALEAIGETATAKLAGWLFSLSLIAHSFLIVVLPRLDKESAIRDLARSWHYAIGIALLVFGAWRLYLWIREHGAIPVGTLPGPARFWHHALCLAVLLLVVIGGPLGFLYGWTEGRDIDPAGLFTLPALVGKDHALWQFSGYFHSATANATVLIALAALGSAGYTYARYGKGLLAAFPAGFGVLFLIRSALFIYAINSFSDRSAGYVAAAIFLGIVAAFWLAARAIRRGKWRAVQARESSPAWKGAAILAVSAVSVFGLYMPHLLFRVTPFASGVMVEADPSITWHRQRLADVAWVPVNEFDTTTGQQTYKWCKFCHTMQPGEAHLAGPNLHNIFGQQAGTVPNFHYSPELSEAGRNGLVWNEETIRRYIAGPDEMVPGTKMMISSGPVTDPEIQDSVIASLKRDTMFTEAERDDQAAR